MCAAVRLSFQPHGRHCHERSLKLAVVASAEASNQARQEAVSLWKTFASPSFKFHDSCGLVSGSSVTFPQITVSSLPQNTQPTGGHKGDVPTQAHSSGQPEKGSPHTYTSSKAVAVVDAVSQGVPSPPPTLGLGWQGKAYSQSDGCFHICIFKWTHGGNSRYLMCDWWDGRDCPQAPLPLPVGEGGMFN